MRRIAAQVEALTPVPFVLLVGLIGGALQAIPRFLLSGSGAMRPHLAQFVLVGVTSTLYWTAAALLWWIAVQRRPWSLWATAAHVALGLVVADILSNGLGMVAASIDTNGAFAKAVVREPLTFASSNLGLILIRSPVWFFGAAIAVALGRHLSGPPPTIASPPSKPTRSEAVT